MLCENFFNFRNEAELFAKKVNGAVFDRLGSSEERKNINFVPEVVYSNRYKVVYYNDPPPISVFSTVEDALKFLDAQAAIIASWKNRQENSPAYFYKLGWNNFGLTKP